MFVATYSRKTSRRRLISKNLFVFISKHHSYTIRNNYKPSSPTVGQTIPRAASFYRRGTANFLFAYLCGHKSLFHLLAPFPHRGVERPAGDDRVRLHFVTYLFDMLFISANIFGLNVVMLIKIIKLHKPISFLCFILFCF